MRNIAILAPNLHSGGSERMACRLTKALSKNYNIFLILFDDSNISYSFTGKLISLDAAPKKGMLGKIITFLKRRKRLMRVLKENKIDLIMGFSSFTMYLLALTKTKAKKVIPCRGFNDLKKKTRIFNLFLKFNDAILFNSLAQVNYYLKSYSKDKKKAYMIYNIFNTDKIIDKSNEMVDEDFFKGNTIITTSHFSKIKGQWNLLKSFEILKKRVKDAKLVFIGHRGSLTEEIKEMAGRSKYKDDIYFLGFQGNPFKYMNRASVYALCSINEGFPNALVEAMLCKTPVVAVDCRTGPGEVLRKKYTDKTVYKATKCDYGYLSPPFDEVIDFDFENISDAHFEYAKALEMALYDKEIGELGYQRGLEFDVNNIIEQYISLIESLI